MKCLSNLLSGLFIVGVLTSSDIFAGATSQATAVAVDPQLGDGRFELSIGKLTGYFDCRGIGTQSDVMESKAGIPRGAPPAKNAGRITVKNLVCSRNLTTSMDFWTWRQLVVDGKLDQARLDATLIVYDETFTPIAEWTLTRTWPVAIDFNETTPGKETIVIAVEQIKRNR